MPDTPRPANEAPITEDSSMVEEVTEQVGTSTDLLPPGNVGASESGGLTLPLAGTLEEEIEEELIIEDFTIDGICGVY